MKPASWRTGAKIALLVAAIFLAIAISWRGSSSESGLIGTAVEETQLPLLGSGEWSLADERGKVVFLSFMAVSCAPCNVEAGEIEQFLLKEFLGDDVAIVAIHVGPETDDRMANFRRKHGLSYPMAVDADAEYSRVVLGDIALPQALVIGRDGRIAAHTVGYGSGEWREWRAAIREALNAGD